MFVLRVLRYTRKQPCKPHISPHPGRSVPAAGVYLPPVVYVSESIPLVDEVQQRQAPMEPVLCISSWLPLMALLQLSFTLLLSFTLFLKFFFFKQELC